ncbi:MAG: hypothetical protein PHI55_10770 [Burkholderiaceae bacterium]|nr:hypothetical protein [Burkholderiaceae bacterium]
MALGWMTALKLVPWSDVIEATPQLVQAARRLLGNRGKGNDTARADADALAGSGSHGLAQRLERLERQQQESVELLESLAEHHARLVQAIEALRRRNQQLGIGLLAVALLAVGLLVWAVRP